MPSSAADSLPGNLAVLFNEQNNLVFLVGSRGDSLKVDIPSLRAIAGENIYSVLSPVTSDAIIPRTSSA